MMDASYDRKRYVKPCACIAKLFQSQGSRNEASRDDLAESTAVLEEVSRTSRRVLGPSHPFTKGIQRDLLLAQEELTAFDAS